MAVLGTSQVAKPDQPEDVRLDAGLGDPLPRRRVGARASVARQRRELADRPLEACSLRKASALEAEDRHRDLPAIAWLADEVSLVDPDAGEEDLAELAAAGHLLDRPDLDPGLMHVDQEKADASMSFRRRVGAGQQEGLVGVVRPARPGLLAAEHPLAVAALGARAQTGQVASRVGLAESLAEDELAAQDLLHVSILLPLGAVGDERWREQRHAKAAEDSRRARLRHLLLVDRLHDRRGAAPADLLRPTELQPPAGVELALPLALKAGVLFVAVPALPVLPPRLGQVRFQPGSDLLPEGFLFGRESEIHG